MTARNRVGPRGAEERKAAPDDVTMRVLAPLLHYDFQVAADMSENLKRFAGVRAEVLLLGGSKSPAYLRAGLDSLERVLPNSTRVEFAGFGHAALGMPTGAACRGRWRRRCAASSSR